MEGQKALRFHQKDFHLCSKDYEFGTTWEWVIHERFNDFLDEETHWSGLRSPYNSKHKNKSVQPFMHPEKCFLVGVIRFGSFPTCPFNFWICFDLHTKFYNIPSHHLNIRSIHLEFGGQDGSKFNVRFIWKKTARPRLKHNFTESITVWYKETYLQL